MVAANYHVCIGPYPGDDFVGVGTVTHDVAQAESSVIVPAGSIVKNRN
jgi:hypothetical protein